MVLRDPENHKSLPTCSFWETLYWDNYKDYTYLGTLEGSYQHTLIATDTRLRPLQAPFLGHILGTKPGKIMGV